MFAGGRQPSNRQWIKRPRNSLGVTNGAWPTADDKYWIAQAAYFAAVRKAVTKKG
jgi:hypothetical protein